MQKSNRTLAFLAYLLPVIGPLLVLLADRKNTFALYHAFQSLGLTLIAIVAPIVWAVCAWLLMWIPLAGGLLAAALFALVVAAYITLFIAWLAGMSNALRNELAPAPVFGGWGERLLGAF